MTTYWLDSEGSELCEECATESDCADEVPQFRPVSEHINEGYDTYCDQCSCVIEGSYGPYPDDEDPDAYDRHFDR